MTETFQVKSLEEMPRALTYLIEKVDSLQETVNTLRHKQQASESPRWMNIDELCAYHPSHPKKQTVYEWVSKKTIPYHKMTKGLSSFRPSRHVLRSCPVLSCQLAQADAEQ